MTYTQQQLDNFWQRYVSMRQVDVIYVANAEPDFAAMIAYCRTNMLYGFGTPRTLQDGTGVIYGLGVSPIVSGPTKS